MSDYAGPILGTVGAIIGYMVAGPAGANLGYALGNAIGTPYSSGTADRAMAPRLAALSPDLETRS